MKNKETEKLLELFDETCAENALPINCHVTEEDIAIAAKLIRGQERNDSILNAIFRRGWYFVETCKGGYYSTEDDDRGSVPGSIEVEAGDMEPYPWNDLCEHFAGEL